MHIITTFLTKNLLQEESSIYKNMLYQKPKAYAVHFLQRGCCARPHTYIGATTYAVHFFQPGYCTQPQMLDHEGGKHIAPHMYIGATTYAVHFFQ